MKISYHPGAGTDVKVSVDGRPIGVLKDFSADLAPGQLIDTAAQPVETPIQQRLLQFHEALARQVDELEERMGSLERTMRAARDEIQQLGDMVRERR